MTAAGGGEARGADAGLALARLAAFAASARLEEMGTDVADLARLVVLDTLGVMVAGAGAGEARALARRLARAGGPCTFAGSARRGGPLQAGIVNATQAVWLDYDAPHRHPPSLPLLPGVHMAAHVVPAALAVGESLGAPGRETLAAIVAGCEVGARLSVAGRLWPGLHPHGSLPSIGAAAAASRLAGAGAGGVLAAVLLAAGLVLMPSFENAYQGRTIRNAAAGVGTGAGMLAARLAPRGLAGGAATAAGVLRGSLSSRLDERALVDGLGVRHEFLETIVKPYPCARYLHPAIEAARSLAARGPTPVDGVREVVVSTYALAAGRDNGSRAPASALEARFSIPYTVACALVKGTVGPADFTPEALADARVRALAGRVRVVADPALTARAPRERPARVVVSGGDGRRWMAETAGSPGGPDDRLPAAAVAAKFMENAAPVLGSARAGALRESVSAIEEVADVRRLTALLVPAPGRKPRGPGRLIPSDTCPTCGQ